MILFITRIPPNAGGPGGSQRSMHLLRAALTRGPVDLVVLYRAGDREAAADPLDSTRSLVRFARTFEVPEWAPSYKRWPRLSWRLGQILEMLSLHSADAPRFSSRTLREIAVLLPARNYDVIYAGHISAACIVDALVEHGLLKVGRKVVDLCDMISRLKERALELDGPGEGRLRRTLQRIDLRRLRAAEVRVARSWDAVSIASASEGEQLSALAGTPVRTLPNVVNRPLLPVAPDEHGARVLFVGHLGYQPNVQGLIHFLDDAWPLIVARLPRARLDVVGMYPEADLAKRLHQAGARLHANVPTVEPFYVDCGLVIAPILLGSGTRIKILEAMAYGRAVVATTVGAEGLGVVSGRDALIADTMPAFADAVVRLAQDAELRATLVENGRRLQQARYSPAAITELVGAMIDAPASSPAGAIGPT
ncbi:glycosyltransferase family 4 protein [uncultured Sphingomonas sp.]|uniref:glycosyltransferase family 4 protein n=1 Tax=uncultured Sphingomonas sp. TaxID=158754 RepID=UPI0035CBC161